MRARRLVSLVWELPQTALGALNYALQRGAGHVAATRVEDGRVLVELSVPGAISLGWFVFFTTTDNPVVPTGPENLRHELGHAVQSRWLGPLYLPVVGVPSVARVIYARAHVARTGRRWAHYYDGWPEKSADELGGVDRAQRPRP